MIGAIKRRWKSKKAKVLHKGPELVTDACPASRGFVDEDFEKMIKPPSPRQIHPVLEQLTVCNSAQPPPPHHHHCPNSRKSSTLPSGGDESCPFIRVNSGRIELVNCGHHKDVGGSPGRQASPHYHLPHPPTTTTEVLSEKLRRRLGGRLRNDSRHSWCGGSRDGKMKGSSGLLLSAPTAQLVPPPGKLVYPNPTTTADLDPTYSDPIEEKEIIRLRTSLLQERLEVLETLNKNASSSQREEKKDVERVMSDLASQVSRAVNLQQLMKSEVEKLQDRIVDLERHNRALATMIVPTLMKLQETVGRGNCPDPGESCAKIKEETRTGESWSGGSTGSPRSLKEKKIDCRIPRINYRLSRTKQSQETESSESPEPSPRVPANGVAVPSPPPNLSSPPRRLSPAFPKSKSSSASIHSRTTATTAAAKSSTFSGIPRMSPNPRAQALPLEKLEKERKGKAPSSPSGSGGNRSGSKNDSQRIPYADFHNNGSGSRLPVLRKNAPKPIKTNPGKVNSVIHHTNHGTATAVGTHKIQTNVAVATTTITATATSSTTQLKPLGKDEGYSTMSSEALAEQEGSLSKSVGTAAVTVPDKDIPGTHLTKSNTFSTFHHQSSFHGDSSPSTTVVAPLPKQLITGIERNWTSLPKSTITTTTASPGVPGVRIVRGISSSVSYEIEDAGETLERGGEPSSTTSTILWEDSDDSDILFLPLEMSSTSGASSPTLVPPSSWNSSRLPSSTSFSAASTASTSAGFGADHPLRRAHGAELVPESPWRTAAAVGGGEPDDEVERALIEKWMRLEDFRNQVQPGDEWAWDWDGVERTTHVSPPRCTVGKNSRDLRLPEFWNFGTEQMIEEPQTVAVVRSPGSVQIDSSTWTKSKKNADQVSLQAFPEGDELGKASSHAAVTCSAMEAGVLELGTGTLHDAGTPSPPPPVIEFTPAYYHLVKYGSNSSVNDKEQLITSSNRRLLEKGEGRVPGPIKTRTFLQEDGEGGRMDDKISQTDFGSSLENLSVSSELFTECRNCLELIKRLVGGIDEACGTSPSGSYRSDREEETTLERHHRHRNELSLVTDNGSPTTWIPVPKGLPTTEVDRILEILSSSESEDVLSPQSSRAKGKNSDFGV